MTEASRGEIFGKSRITLKKIQEGVAAGDLDGSHALLNEKN